MITERLFISRLINGALLIDVIGRTVRRCWLPRQEVGHRHVFNSASVSLGVSDNLPLEGVRSESGIKEKPLLGRLPNDRPMACQVGDKVKVIRETKLPDNGRVIILPRPRNTFNGLPPLAAATDGLMAAFRALLVVASALMELARINRTVGAFHGWTLALCDRTKQHQTSSKCSA